jgi:hypothetical protein
VRPGATTLYLPEIISNSLADQRGPRQARTPASRILMRVVYAVNEGIGAAAASTYIRSANRYLDDNAVLVLLRDGDPTKHEKHIIAATRAFLE